MIRNKYHSINVLAPSHLCVSVKSEHHKITEKAQCLFDQALRPFYAVMKVYCNVVLIIDGTQLLSCMHWASLILSRVWIVFHLITTF